MSIMAIKHILITAPKLAVTAILSGWPLRFIKYFKDMIKCRGTYCASDLFPVLLFMHDMAIVRSPRAHCPNPPLHALNPRGRDTFIVLASIWGLL